MSNRIAAYFNGKNDPSKPQPGELMLDFGHTKFFYKDPTDMTGRYETYLEYGPQCSQVALMHRCDNRECHVHSGMDIMDRLARNGLEPRLIITDTEIDFDIVSFCVEGGRVKCTAFTDPLA